MNTELPEIDVSYSKSTRDDFSPRKFLLLKVSCCRQALPPLLAPPVLFPLSSAQRNTKGHPANMLQLGINSPSTTCQRDEIFLSRRGDAVLHIAAPSSLGGGCGVLKAGKQLVKDRGRGAKTKTSC